MLPPRTSKSDEHIDFVTCSENKIKLWNIESGKCSKTIEEKEPISTFLYIDDDKAATGHKNGRIKILNLITRECLIICPGESSVLCIITLNPTTLVAGYSNGRIILWNIVTGKEVQTLSGHKASVRCLARINRIAVASGADDGELKIWNIEKSACVKTFVAHKKSYVLCLKMLSNKKLVSSSYGEIKVWDLLSCACVKTLQGHSGRVYDLLRVTDEKFISCSSDLTIKVWDVEHSKCLLTLQGHKKDIKCISKISFDLFGSCGLDSKLKIWEVVSGKCVKTLKMEDQIISMISLRKDLKGKGGLNRHQSFRWGHKEEKGGKNDERLLILQRENEELITSKKYFQKEIKLLREQNKKLQSNNVSAVFGLLKDRMAELQPKTYEKEFKELNIEPLRLMRKKNLDNEEENVRHIEFKFMGLIKKFEKSIENLKDNQIFNIIEEMMSMKRQRDKNISIFDERLKKMNHDLAKLCSIKICITKQQKIQNIVKSIENYMGLIGNVINSSVKKFNDKKFIESKRNLNEDFEEYMMLTSKLVKEQKELTNLIHKQNDFFKKHKQYKKYFTNYQPIKAEIEKKIKIHQRFFDILSSLNEVLKRLITMMNLNYIKTKNNTILEKQKKRQEYNKTLEKNFKVVFLKNNKVIDKVEKLDRVIKEDVESMFGKIAKDKEIFKKHLLEVKKINSSKNSNTEKIKLNIISEIEETGKCFNEFEKQNENIRKTNALHYGKIFDIEEIKVLGGLKIKKKRLAYFGQIKNGLREGIGKEFYEDGKVVKFYGKFQKGERYGRGEEYDRKGLLINKGEYSTGGVELKIYKLSELMGHVDTVKDLLGKGSFGEVYKVKLDGNVYALKRIFLKKENVVEINRFKNEVRILSKLRHPNIIAIYGWGEYEDESSLQFGIIVEYCPKKINPKGMKFEDKMSFMLQIVQGMGFLHSKDIIHRDLKFENVLVNKFNQGLSKQLETYKLTKNITKTVMGTPGYIAPEVLDEKDYTNKCDVFSFGIMMYNLLFETDDPYDTQNNPDPYFSFKLSEHIIRGVRPRIPQNHKLKQWTIDLMRRCWDQQPKKRPSFDEIVEIISQNF